MAINENDFIGFGPAVDNAGARHTINHLPETEEWEAPVDRGKTAAGSEAEPHRIR